MKVWDQGCWSFLKTGGAKHLKWLEFEGFWGQIWQKIGKFPKKLGGRSTPLPHPLQRPWRYRLSFNQSQQCTNVWWHVSCLFLWVRVVCFALRVMFFLGHIRKPAIYIFALFLAMTCIGLFGQISWIDSCFKGNKSSIQNLNDYFKLQICMSTSIYHT